MINSAFPEMLHCLRPPSPDNLSGSPDANAVHWQQEQQHLPQFHEIINTNFGDELHYSPPIFSFLPPTQLLPYPSLPPANPSSVSPFPHLPIKNESSHIPLNSWPHFPQSDSLQTQTQTQTKIEMLSSGFPAVAQQKSHGLISRTLSCPPHVGNTTIEVHDIPPLPDKIPSTKETFRKRRTDKAPNPKALLNPHPLQFPRPILLVFLSFLSETFFIFFG